MGKLALQELQTTSTELSVQLKRGLAHSGQRHRETIVSETAGQLDLSKSFIIRACLPLMAKPNGVTNLQTPSSTTFQDDLLIGSHGIACQSRR